jgi:hypothetical protein
MGTIIIFPVIDSAVDTPAIVGLGNSAGRRAMSALDQKQTFAPQKAMSALPPIATAKADFRCPLWAKSGHHCGSSSFGKLFMPLGTAVLTAVK